MNKYEWIICGLIGSSAICAATSILLINKVKKLQLLLNKFAHMAEFYKQHSEDNFTILSSNICALVDSLYQLGIFDDDDILSLNEKNNAELLERLTDAYGAVEGKRRFDIYTDKLNDVVNLTFYKNMN